MPGKTPEDHAQQMIDRASPAERRFVEYLCGEYARQAFTTAIACGLTPDEANYVVKIACAGAAKATKQAIQQCQRDRRFTRIGH